MNYKGKRKAPNNMYWVNAQIAGQNKLVMAEQLNEIEFKLWSNSNLAGKDKTFKHSETKPGWYFKNVLHDEVAFHNWN